jgi:hypothetical protein
MGHPAYDSRLTIGSRGGKYQKKLRSVIDRDYASGQRNLWDAYI